MHVSDNLAGQPRDDVAGDPRHELWTKHSCVDERDTRTHGAGALDVNVTGVPTVLVLQTSIGARESGGASAIAGDGAAMSKVSSVPLPESVSVHGAFDSPLTSRSADVVYGTLPPPSLAHASNIARPRPAKHVRRNVMAYFSKRTVIATLS